jgi:hypothetical protein
MGTKFAGWLIGLTWRPEYCRRSMRCRLHRFRPTKTVALAISRATNAQLTGLSCCDLVRNGG